MNKLLIGLLSLLLILAACSQAQSSQTQGAATPGENAAQEGGNAPGVLTLGMAFAQGKMLHCTYEHHTPEGTERVEYYATRDARRAEYYPLNSDAPQAVYIETPGAVYMQVLPNSGVDETIQQHCDWIQVNTDDTSMDLDYSEEDTVDDITVRYADMYARFHCRLEPRRPIFQPEGKMCTFEDLLGLAMQAGMNG